MGRPLLDVLKAALEGGARAIQLREKGLPDLELYRWAEKVKRLCGDFDAEFFVNDRIDIGLGVEATGVHLGGHSFSVAEARRVVGSRLKVGASTHSVSQARTAEAEGADFVVFGPIYFTPSKALYGEPLGVENLREAVSSVKVPVLAIGGIKSHSIAEVLAAGASGVAVISAILSANDPKIATQEIVSLLSKN